jgi:N-glycosylase/DNA lyase
MSRAEYKKLRRAYSEKRDLIGERLSEFRLVLESGDDGRIFEELAFCICTAGASAKMGMRSVEALRDVLLEGDLASLQQRMTGVHRFPNWRPAYIVHTREYLRREHGLGMRRLVMSFTDPLERRDFFARNKDIKGIGYKEASHFLRNIGLPGYAILDKHILNTLFEMGVIESPKPPGTRDRYIAAEERLRKFSEDLDIPMDELDLLLWSEKTGEILK